MVANHRCNEIKEDAYKHVEGKLKTLAQSSEKEITDDFRDQVDSILSEATTQYTSNANSYKKEIQDNFKIDLEKNIQNFLFPSFKDQVRLIKESKVANFKEERKKIDAKPLEDIVTNLIQTLENLKTNELAGFDSHKTHKTAKLFEG